MQDDDLLEQALREVRATHEQLVSAQRRLLEIRDTYRMERDEAIRYAISLGGSRAKKEICVIIDASPQWLNKLLRGEAYRRSSD